MQTMPKFNDIQFVFENCEVIHIDVNAIKAMRFHESGTQYLWYPRDLNMLYAKKLDDFYIKLDMSHPEYFKHPDNQINMGDPVERLFICTDISSVIVNGTEFSVAWDEVNQFYNAYQHTYKDKENGVNMLEFRIKEPNYGSEQDS